jgi:hypothetical protein
MARARRQVAYRELASHLNVAACEDLFEAVLPTRTTSPWSHLRTQGLLARFQRNSSVVLWFAVQSTAAYESSSDSEMQAESSGSSNTITSDSSVGRAANLDPASKLRRTGAPQSVKQYGEIVSTDAGIEIDASEEQ